MKIGRLLKLIYLKFGAQMPCGASLLINQHTTYERKPTELKGIIMKFLESYQEQAYALLRITAGFMFLLHGTTVFFEFPESSDNTGLMITVAGTIKLVGGILIFLGLTTRAAAFISSGTMAVSYGINHATESFYPLINGGEPDALFCFIFLFIACKGSGIWSMDNK